MPDSSIPLLRELTEAHAVSGFEDEVRDIFIRELSGKGDIGQDRLGSVYCRPTDDGQEPCKLVIAGHMDEVGFRVQAVTKQGFLTFVPIGGWWGHNLLAQRVVVKTSSGDKIPGVITSKPPHFLSEIERKKVQQIEAMFIDIGASSSEEVSSWGVRIGDPIAPESSFLSLKKEGRYMAKAFDNRVGMAAAIDAGQKLLPAATHLAIAGTVQEEVGLRGSRTLGNLLQPEYAIVLEGPPADDTPGFDTSVSQGILGQGVQIRLHDPSAIMNRGLADLAISTAHELGIPHQVTVRQSGGTDAGGFQFAGEGTACLVLGVPCRYIHSHNAVMDLHDYHAMVELTVKLAEKVLSGAA